jgi:hypothetical protein
MRSQEVIFPDDFLNPIVYSYRAHHYAIQDNVWYRLWGWVPDGGREATAITDAELIERLDTEAREHPPHG